ncbi:MAG: hypothetical protein LBU17_01680 [Treponema sp.]|jgi:hypothetical protein|nr:hypothetical protein [Treponema sp.]
MGKEKPEKPEADYPVQVGPDKAGTVTVFFKNTYIGTHGIFYRKNRYTISRTLADMLKDDIEHAEDA